MTNDDQESCGRTFNPAWTRLNSIQEGAQVTWRLILARGEQEQERWQRVQDLPNSVIFIKYKYVAQGWTWCEEPHELNTLQLPPPSNIWPGKPKLLLTNNLATAEIFSCSAQMKFQPIITSRKNVKQICCSLTQTFRQDFISYIVRHYRLPTHNNGWLAGWRDDILFPAQTRPSSKMSPPHSHTKYNQIT